MNSTTTAFVTAIASSTISSLMNGMNQTSTSSMSEQNSDLINNLCLPKGWRENADLFNQDAEKTAAVGFTPCFEQLVIMSPVYIIVIILTLIRLIQLIRFRSKYPEVAGRLSDTGLHTLRIVCSLVAFLQPLVIITYLSVTATELDPVAPFEYVGSGLAAGCWFFATIVLLVERFKLFLPKHNWIMRFNFTFVFIASCVQFRSVVLLASLPNRSYYTYTYLPSFLAIFLLFVLAHVHYPQLAIPDDIDAIDNEMIDEYVEKHRERRRSQSKAGRNVFPVESANIFSRLSFGWMTPLVRLGFKRPLEEDDVWQLPERDLSDRVNPQFAKAWIEQKKSNNPSLTGALNSAFGGPFWLSIIPKFFNDASQFVGPLILQELIAFARDPNAPDWHGYLWAVALFVGMMLGALGENIYFWMCMRVGVRVRTALMNGIYEKALVISNNARRVTSTGAITNYMSTDAERVAMSITSLHGLWSSPLRIIVALILLGFQLGWAAAAGLASLILLIPFQAKLVSKSAQYQKSTLLATDERLSVVNEILNGMRVIKFYAWEPSFADATQEKRLTELKHLRKNMFYKAVNFMLFSINPVIVSLVSFGVYVAIGNELTAEIAFTSLALFNVLRFPLIFLPQTLQGLVEARISLNRMRDFLLSEDQPIEDETKIKRLLETGVGEASNRKKKSKSKSKEKVIVIKNGGFVWGDETNTFQMSDINVEVEKGSLVMVLGGTGQGKSSLLSAMLGQMEKVTGEVAVADDIAYVAQQAWIFNDTVKGNILFGLEEEPERYQKTVHSCSLMSDLEQFPAGDDTEIGEKGVNLSGGQKQRVNIARAVYSGANIVMLDDPLSALDAHVAREIFQNCVCGDLKKKTRVLVTNQLQFVPHADKIIMMESGNVVEQGTFGELYAAKGPFYRLMLDQGLTELIDADDDIEQVAKRVSELEITRSNKKSTKTVVEEESSDSGADRSEIFEDDNNNNDIDETNDAVDDDESDDDTNDDDDNDKEQTEESSVDSGADIESDSYTYEYQEVSEDSTDGAKGRKGSSGPKGKSKKKVSHSSSDQPVELKKKQKKSKSTKETTDESTKQQQQELIDDDNNDDDEDKPADPAANKDVAKQSVFRQDHSKEAELIEKEERTTGSVKFSVYATYIKATGGAFALLLLGLFLSATEASRVGGSFWLSYWSSADSSAANTPSQGYFLGIYAALSLSLAILQLIVSICIVVGSNRASRVLHGLLMKAVLAAPMSFFDTTPLGRIVNRFSKDISQIDMALPFVAQIFISGVFQFVGTLAVIGINTPYALVVFVPVFAVFLYVQTYFRRTSRELKRLDAISRSPIYANFTETLNGIPTIRAYGAEGRMNLKNNNTVDNNQRINLATWAANRWLSMRLELLGGIMILSTAVFVVFQRNELSPDIVGLTLTYALTITSLLAMIVRLATETEVAFNAVERVDYYTQIEPEAEPIIKDKRPKDDWPKKGAIEFKDVVMRYRPELPPVLTGLSASLKGREKVGVVGRTGAGKSTLFQALFRLVEIDSGSIKIDGQNINQFGLADVRKRLGIIPQDPVLFSGTIRFNLDPFSEFSDRQIWKALESAHLKHVVAEIPDKLSGIVSEGGQNFSVGQRQLLCLARALLRHASILVIDEATANVDVETDALIQVTIRKEFADRTTLTIAHRLVTIIDCDRIIVMSKGKIVEFDTPKKLLKNKKSVFYAMVQETGPEMAQRLHDIANGVVQSDFDEFDKAKRLIEMTVEEEDAADKLKEQQQVGAGEAMRGSREQLFKTAKLTSSAGSHVPLRSSLGDGRRRSSNVPVLLQTAGLTTSSGLVWRTERQREVAMAAQTLFDALRQVDDDVWIDDLQASQTSLAAWKGQLQSTIEKIEKLAEEKLPTDHTAIVDVFEEQPTTPTMQSIFSEQ